MEIEKRQKIITIEETSDVSDDERVRLPRLETDQDQADIVDEFDVKPQKKPTLVREMYSADLRFKADKEEKNASPFKSEAQFGPPKFYEGNEEPPVQRPDSQPKVNNVSDVFSGEVSQISDEASDKQQDPPKEE